MVKIIFKIDKEQDSKNWNRVIAIRDLPYGAVAERQLW